VEDEMDMVVRKSPGFKRYFKTLIIYSKKRGRGRMTSPNKKATSHHPILRLEGCIIHSIYARYLFADLIYIFNLGMMCS